ncbi:beta:beta-carotene 9' [Dinothrombium tinctorium]|uniref:Beta:beta-carotene 9 n=1 Tax=Dinothrombium tinctorium TaxID=1965070 RepID=A0A3S3NT84_9ACAR|nr:beta:beta-carotene 9' [Dinothrombium tinctorium]RWS15396.1 beta:beta-carotene 9' [Dinothrombium tinctorium]
MVEGSLIRNGPGKQRIGCDEFKHMFDGSALIRKFDIENGRVFYRSRFLRSKTFERNMACNRIVVSEFGTEAVPDPCKTLLDRFMAYFTIDKLFSDNDLVNIVEISDELYALSETPFITKIDKNNLSTLEHIDMRKYLAVNIATAHPHYDTDKNVYNIGSNFGCYSIVKIPKEKGFQQGSVVANIPAYRPFNPSYYHSFCLTENFFVFIEQALVLSVSTAITQHFFGGSNSNIFKWIPEYMNKFHLTSRQDGKELSHIYVSDPFMFFHTINAYEDNDHVIVDICCYNDDKVLQTLFMDAIKEAEADINSAKKQADYIRSQARRFVLPLIRFDDQLIIGQNLNRLENSSAVAVVSENFEIKCTPEALTEESAAMAEMPTINYKNFNGKKYRYFYALCRRDDLLCRLMKCDTRTKSIVLWEENNFYPSEPIFVPRPDAIDEDDGIILSSVISEIENNKGFLLILDAKSMKEIARAEMETPSYLPPDFHGYFC